MTESEIKKKNKEKFADTLVQAMVNSLNKSTTPKKTLKK